MALTPRGIWTPDSGEEYDLTVDAATTASTTDNALQKAANYGVGTQAEMNAALGQFPDGAMWFNTTNDTEYRRVAGAWVSTIDDTGWVTLTASGGWTVTSFAYRIKSGIVYLRGEVYGGDSGTVFGTLPGAARPSTRLGFVAKRPSALTTAYGISIQTNGQMTLASEDWIPEGSPGISLAPITFALG